MTIDQRESGNVTILEIKGNMTIDVLRDMVVVDMVRALLQQGRNQIVLHLEAVKYVDTMGLCNIVEAFITAQRKGGVLKLLRITPHVREMLSVTKLLPLFEVFESESAAVASFEQMSA
jgi:anti-sigma B factor antagonist